jgi:geranylgeranyl diphosphate synthase type II
MMGMPVDVKSLIQEGAALADQALEELLPSVETVPASIHGAMRHSIFAGGKRPLPALCRRELPVWARLSKCCTRIR